MLSELESRGLAGMALMDGHILSASANLPNLRPGSVTASAAIRDRAVEAADGNPRLLDWLDKIVADPAVDVDGLMCNCAGSSSQPARRVHHLLDNYVALRWGAQRCQPTMPPDFMA